MKAAFVFTAISLTLSAFSQTAINKPAPIQLDSARVGGLRSDSLKRICICCGSFAASNKKPLIVVNGRSIVTDQTQHLSLLGAQDIKEISVLKSADAKKTYGDIAKDGVILIKTKKQISYVSLKDFIRQRGLFSKALGLKICVNDRVLEKPEDFFMEASASLVVQIKEERYYVNNVQIDRPEKYMNISLK